MSASEVGPSTLAARLSRAYSSLPRSLRVFLVLVCAFTSASLLSALIWRSLGMRLPYSSSYYFVPKDMFQDFQSFRPRFGIFGTPDFFVKPPGQYVMYPASLIFPIAWLMRPEHPIRGFLLLLGVAIFGFAFLLQRCLRAAGLSSGSAWLFTLTAVVTSYPVLYLVQRGNLEVLVWIPVTLGLFLFRRGNYTLAAVALGTATSLKLYPFIFLSLLLLKQRYKELTVGIVTAISITLLALWGLGPTISAAYQWNSVQLQAFGKYFAASTWAIGYDHSFFSLVKFFSLPWQPDLTSLVRPYTLSMAVLGLAIFAGFLWRLPELNQIYILSILTITIPPVSYDYTLLTLYAAFGMLCVLAVRASRAGVHIRSLTAHFVLLACVFTPESYVMIAGGRYGAQVRCICLIAAIVLALRFPLALPEEAEKQGGRWMRWKIPAPGHP